MELAMVGLGRMGGNMARRLLLGGHRVVVWNRTLAKAQELESAGAEAVERLEDVPGKLAAPRAIWFMLPYGAPTDEAIDALVPLLAKGDIVIDGGNSPYQHDVERGARLEAQGLRYLDAGTSGGVWGLEVGYCLMVGGDRSAFEQIEPALATLAPPGHGYEYCGGHGAGHFVKMVHNGIEYGMMQAYGEGFELLKESGYDLDLPGPSPTSGTRAAWCAPGCSSWPSMPLPKTRDWSASRVTSTTPARAAGPCSRRSTVVCPCRSSPCRCSRAFVPARPIRSRARSWPRCATSSAATR